MINQKKAIPLFSLIIIFLYMPLFSIEKKVADSAAEYICIKAKEGKKKNLAIYTFTEKNGEATPNSQGYATRIIEVILDKKEFKVIDPDKVSKIIEEQEKGLTGLVDPDTAPETGKMIGADVLIFGITDKNTIQIRILDSVTGEIIGATVAESGGSAKTSNEDFKSGENKKRFYSEQAMKILTQIYTKNPKKFLYITANDSEFAELEKNYPRAMNDARTKYQEPDSKRKGSIEKKKKRFLQYRTSDPEFDNKIKAMRKKALEDLESKKGKKKRMD